jgi:catechol 2,3-dioxygenase-like lactoylglutathione lyase family enzyme
MPAPPPIETFRPFVPAKDLQVSLRFYRQLGFEVVREFGDGSGAIIVLGPSSLILTRFFDKAYAENFMMQLVVPDLDRWWEHVTAARLHETFEVPPPKPPAIQPWGLMVAYVVDPSGVLWHVVPSHGA